MGDLIRRQDAIDVVAKLYKYESDRMTALQELPTVEAKPVVMGEWKSDLDSCGWINHTCSHCGYEKLTDIHVSLDWNFCPNCGADMRGEKHD